MPTLYRVLPILTLCKVLQIRAGLGWAGLGWAGLGWAGLGWAGLGWAGLGWAGLGWAGLDLRGEGEHNNNWAATAEGHQALPGLPYSSPTPLAPQLMRGAPCES
ncbi:hypothetical protein V8C86DRAFT_763360 [Haematococcus lacustris]